MISPWAFPAPRPAAGHDPRPPYVPPEGWPLEHLEPWLLMLLAPELQRLLDRLEPGATVDVGYGPGSPFRVHV